MRASSLPPARARPRKRVIFVLAPLSSTKTSRHAGSAARCLCHRALFSATSGRFCSAANRVFFISPTQLPQPQIDRGSPKGTIQASAQLRQGGVRLLGQQLAQSFLALFREQCFASTQMRLGLERAALPEPLAHPAYRRHAKPQEFRDLSSALALLIELQNALAHRNRYGSHEHTLPPTFPFVKLHY